MQKEWKEHEPKKQRGAWGDYSLKIMPRFQPPPQKKAKKDGPGGKQKGATHGKGNAAGRVAFGGGELQGGLRPRTVSQCCLETTHIETE